MNTRNLLLIGATYSGKSTLANVLSETNNFKERESVKEAAEAENFQRKEFEWRGMKHCVVDTIGMKTMPAKDKIARLLPEGISRFLFVVDEALAPEEIKEALEDFKIFKKSFFKSDISKYTTIVRTKFSNFKDEKSCKEDQKKLCRKINKISEMKIVHVDNPPINIIVIDNVDRERIEDSKKKREKSRKILLDHLDDVCKKNKIYKVK